VGPLRRASLSPQPLAGRKTDEGFAIYKEDELGINAEAGGQFNPSLCEFIHVSLGTPSCPFDCNCCKCWSSASPGLVINHSSRFLNNLCPSQTVPCSLSKRFGSIEASGSLQSTVTGGQCVANKYVKSPLLVLPDVLVWIVYHSVVVGT
jgi:hypothetical protein